MAQLGAKEHRKYRGGDKMQPGVIRESEAPTKVYENMPLWMQTICNNTPAYVNFYTDLTRSIVRCEQQIAELFARGDDRQAAIMLGKRDTLKEMRHILEAYKKEEENNG